MGSSKTGESHQLLIGDDLLIEILSRIPTTVAAIRCKLVCKGWCSLISSSYFISRFKQQHIQHESRYPKPLSGMLVDSVGRVSMGNPDDHEFNFRGFNLDYLPQDEENGKVNVLASCNDLILCRGASCNYYLCNPFTMQWVALPPSPTEPLNPFIRTGLVCEPYNRGRGGTIDDQFRYRIVLFHDYSPVEMYCSETGEWILCDDLDEDCLWFESEIAAYNGKLYWVQCDGQYLITYDPFNMTQTSLRFINGDGLHYNEYMHCSYVRECEGVLRVARLGPWQTYTVISVWELQEEEVIFKDHIVFNQDIFSMSWLTVAGFHPRNKDVLFLRVGEHSIASFNTKTGVFKVETQRKDGYRYGQPFTLQLPWWPTTILSHSPLEGYEPKDQPTSF